MASASLERRRTLTLAACIIGSSLAFIDATAVIVALPTIEEDLDLGLAGQQWVFLSYSLALASLYLVGGAVGDRAGRRTVFVWGVVGFAAASLLAGIAPNGAVLIVARALQGVAGAFLTTNSLALIRSVYGDEAGRAIGRWTALTSLATIIGPPAGRRDRRVDVLALDLPPEPPVRDRDGRARPRGPLRREACRAHRAARHPRRRPRGARLRLPHVRRGRGGRPRVRRDLVGVRRCRRRAHRVRRRRTPRRGADAPVRALPAREPRGGERRDIPRVRGALRLPPLLHALHADDRLHPVRGGPDHDADDARDDPAGGALRRARGHSTARGSSSPPGPR